ncbi:hypothetical protein BC832DRAFT_538434 [Gaertneriomyces semiglobifer]|nr:hypothetical protein BC832DRAFT_538434 [Gaertneriomyces semiglobifer]
MNLPVTPYARIATAAVATEKKLILLGGNVRDGSGITHDAARAELSRSMAAGVTVFNYTDYATHHTPLLCGPRFTVDRTNVTGQTCNVYSKTGLVYCFGGTRLCEEEDLLTGISILNPETSTWVNDLPVDVPRRWGHASTVVGDHLYIFGGETVNKRMLHDFWCISLRTNVPTALGFRQLYARSPPARQYACFIPISDEHLLLYGGFGDTSVLGDAWVYDIKFDTWKEATSWFAGTLPSARAGMTCTLSEGKVLMFGGVDQNQQLLSDFWVLDPLKWTWTMEHAVPGLRAEKREVGISVVGDTAATANPGETQLDVPYPSARAHHSAASVGKYLVITGGATSYNDTLREFYATDRRIYIFNVKTSQWVSDTQQLSGFEVEMDLVRVEASSHKWPIIVGGVGAAVVLLSVLLAATLA